MGFFHRVRQHFLCYTAVPRIVFSGGVFEIDFFYHLRSLRKTMVGTPLPSTAVACVIPHCTMKPLACLLWSCAPAGREPGTRCRVPGTRPGRDRNRTGPSLRPAGICAPGTRVPVSTIYGSTENLLHTAHRDTQHTTHLVTNNSQPRT